MASSSFDGHRRELELLASQLCWCVGCGQLNRLLDGASNMETCGARAALGSACQAQKGSTIGIILSAYDIPLAPCGTDYFVSLETVPLQVSIIQPVSSVGLAALALF